MVDRRSLNKPDMESAVSAVNDGDQRSTIKLQK